MKQFATLGAAVAAVMLSAAAVQAEDKPAAAGTSKAADTAAMNSAAVSAANASTNASATTGTGGMAATSAAGGQLSADDKSFVEKATIGGLFEVKSSELAQQKAQSDEVKQFAQLMLTDHMKAGQELMASAQQKQIQQPSDLDEKHAEMLKKLQGAAGTDFDKEYSKVQLKAHKEAVSLFEKASKDCDDPDLKAWAGKTLPTLKQHLDAIKKIAGSDEDKSDK